ncbi:Nucleotide-binding universal stress protein, UspA family [Nonomuraea solani]|uniref:Nucleotide-binding universal stress protein, UspA family n=1 Tax=Nonomuraea solani TaxID=1144553 RepID=A0A1H6F009_9ACTN|nr:universal stress protein [Nonomuraea solani]SEH02455.1 Nucleotide-binding universal stress protein, UspA family [Nonomuraea solani]
MNRRIVVGVDGSAPAMAAVEWAADDARGRGAGLRIVHVCEQCPQAEHCARALAAAGERARELADGVEVSTEVLPGNVIKTLIAESASADSVVLGTRGLGGFAEMVVGSVSMAVAGHAEGPVVVVHAPSVKPHGRVVVGYDRSEHSEAAMGYAIEQARARAVPLHVVFAWQTPVFSPYMAAYNSLLVDAYQADTWAVAESVTQWREKNPGVEITYEAVTGHPVHVLARAGESADLVVVGSRGLGGLASTVLGSVSHGVLHHVACPVAVVRPR